MYRLRFIALLALIVLAPLSTLAEDSTTLLRDAIRERIAVSFNRKTGASIPAYHCRKAPEGCKTRLTAFATYLVRAGERHGVDPWLMAAMAFRESGFNPFAMGSLGELGILQIHPRRRDAKAVRFMTDEWYRKRCRRKPGACQHEIVNHAASVLARSLAQCDGDVSDALGAYNTGRCGGNLRYSKRILEERLRLRRSVGLEAPSRTKAARRSRAAALQTSS